MAKGYARDNESDQPPSDAVNAEASSNGTASDSLADIEAYEKEFQKWEQRGKQILHRYRDERSEATNLRVVSRKFNILWSNTETLKPTLYARLPRVQVERRFKDADPTGRTACEIAERAGNYLLETSPFDHVMRLCVHDRLLPGRAVIWINYRAELTQPDGPMASDDDEDEAKETPLEKIHEMIEPIYVDWRDFGHSPRRTWQEVNRVWRICYMTRNQLVERFGDELGNKLPLDRKHDDSKDKKVDTIKDTSSIYEVWDRERKKVCWIHKSEKDYLEEVDPPIDLQDFWPIPRPIWATLTNDTLVPVPEYVMYQDQAAELDKLTNRIGRFTDGLKLAGVSDASVPELTRLLSPNGTPDNMLIPVANFNALNEKGGLKGAVQLLPVQEIANTLLSLYQARDQVMNVIYQVTGIADVIRGSSDPNETATAQSLKGQFASLRIKDTQAEVARFARDAARIMVEMAVEMYEPETLYEMVQADQFCDPSPREQQRAQTLQQFGIQPPKPMDAFMAAMKMLKDDKLRSFHVDIETDSTIALNEQEDKKSVTEFIGAVGQFITAFGPVVQTQPALAPVIGEMLLFASRRFKAGRAVESSIEQAVKGIIQQANQPKPPDPKMVVAQAQADTAKVRGQAEVTKSQEETKQAQLETQRSQMDNAATLAHLQHEKANIAVAGHKEQRETQGQQFDQAIQARQQVHNEHMDVADHLYNVLALRQKNQLTAGTKQTAS